MISTKPREQSDVLPCIFHVNTKPKIPLVMYNEIRAQLPGHCRRWSPSRCRHCRPTPWSPITMIFAISMGSHIILKFNFCFDVNKTRRTTRCVTLYISCKHKAQDSMGNVKCIQGAAPKPPSDTISEPDMSDTMNAMILAILTGSPLMLKRSFCSDVNKTWRTIWCVTLYLLCKHKAKIPLVMYNEIRAQLPGHCRRWSPSRTCRRCRPTPWTLLSLRSRQAPPSY